MAGNGLHLCRFLPFQLDKKYRKLSKRFITHIILKRSQETDFLASPSRSFSDSALCLLCFAAHIEVRIAHGSLTTSLNLGHLCIGLARSRQRKSDGLEKKRYKDAEVFYHRAYAGYRKTLGEKHPTTVVYLWHYSSMLKEEKGW